MPSTLNGVESIVHPHARTRASCDLSRHERWWPWLYEVLVAQWTEVLATARGAHDDAGGEGGKRSAGAASGYPFTRESLPHHTT